MSTLETRIAKECTAIARTHRYDGHDFRDKDPQNCKCGWKGDDYAAHLETLFAAVWSPVIAEAKADALREGLKWFSEAVEEAAQKALAPSGAPDLASAYWDGYRSASREIADLLTEPKLAEKAIARSDKLDTL